jgi:hypothetical protein
VNIIPALLLEESGRPDARLVSRACRVDNDCPVAGDFVDMLPHLIIRHAQRTPDLHDSQVPVLVVTYIDKKQLLPTFQTGFHFISGDFESIHHSDTSFVIMPDKAVSIFSFVSSLFIDLWRLLCSPDIEIDNEKQNEYDDQHNNQAECRSKPFPIEICHDLHLL